MRYNPTDFPSSGHWRRTVALANREPSSAYKPSRHEINPAEVVAIFDADDKCRAYLQARPTSRRVVGAEYDPGESASGGVGRTDAAPS